VNVSSVDWNTWLYGPGLPPDVNRYDHVLTNNYKTLASAWIDKSKKITPEDTSSYSVNQLSGLIEELIKSERIFELDEVKAVLSVEKINGTKNFDLQFVIYQLCLKCNYVDALPNIVTFLESQGRMKYVRPIYRGLFASSFGKEIAVNTFQKNKNNYHPICGKMLAKDLSLEF